VTTGEAPHAEAQAHVIQAFCIKSLTAALCFVSLPKIWLINCHNSNSIYNKTEEHTTDILTFINVITTLWSMNSE
jgi:hypothetical protein